MDKLLNNEYAEIETKDLALFEEKLKFISTHLEWYSNDVSDTRILIAAHSKNEIDGQMQFLDDGTCGTYADKLERTAPLTDMDAADQCYKESNRFVVLRDARDRLRVVPTFHTAQKGLLARRGCDCPAITGNYSILRPIPSIEEGFLNDATRRCKSREQWGILDGGCISNVSEGYVPLDCYLGYSAFKKELLNNWEQVRFSYGRISYEYYLADFEILDDIALDGLKNTLLGLGIKVNSLKAYARYTTSDVTASAMAGSIVYELDGVPLRLSGKKGVEHKGDASIRAFSAKIKDIGMLMKESEDQVEKLGNTDIEHPADCLENALKKVGLYNKWGRDMVDLVAINPSEITSALDVIIMCSKVLKDSSIIEKWSIKKVIETSENVSRLLNCRFSDLDKAS